MPSDTDVSARHEHWHQELSPIAEIIPKLLLLPASQNGESRQRVTLAAANLRGQTPNAAATDSEFDQFFFAELKDAVRRISADGLNRVGRLLFQPLEAIRMFDSVHSLAQFKFQL